MKVKALHAAEVMKVKALHAAGVMKVKALHAVCKFEVNTKFIIVTWASLASCEQHHTIRPDSQHIPHIVIGDLQCLLIILQIILY